MLAQKSYAATKVGSTGRMTFAGMVSVGSPPDDAGYQRFATEVLVLEAMAAAGDIRIDNIHRESSTGHRYADMVTFTRLK